MTSTPCDIVILPEPKLAQEAISVSLQLQELGAHYVLADGSCYPPLLIGGRSTTTLIEGDDLKSIEDLQKIRTLQLIEAKPLNDSYLHVRYSVVVDKG